MMLHIWILCGKDLFNMGIYHLIQTKINFTVCISMYVTNTTATPNGHQMAVVTWYRSIRSPVNVQWKSVILRRNINNTETKHGEAAAYFFPS